MNEATTPLTRAAVGIGNNCFSLHFDRRVFKLQ